MAGNGVNVDIDAVRKLAQQVTGTIVPQIQGDIRTLDSTVQSLLASWKGNRGQKFAQAYSTFQDDSRKMHEALNTIGGLLQKTAQAYSQADEP